MKKSIFILALVLLVASASYSGQIKRWIYPEKTVTKSVHLTILQEDTYKTSAYTNSLAMLNVMVIRLKESKMDTLSVKEYPQFRLPNLSSYSRKFNESIHVYNVADREEQIIVLYTIIYKSKGSLLKIPGVKYIGKGATNDSLYINM